MVFDFFAVYTYFRNGGERQFLRVNLFHPLPSLDSKHTIPPSDMASVVCVGDKYH